MVAIAAVFVGQLAAYPPDPRRFRIGQRFHEPTADMAGRMAYTARVAMPTVATNGCYSSIGAPLNSIIAISR